MGSQKPLSSANLPGSSQSRRDFIKEEHAFLRNREWTSSCTDFQLDVLSPVDIPFAHVDAGRHLDKLGRVEPDDADPAGCRRLALGVLLAIAVMSAITMTLAVLDKPFGSTTRSQNGNKAALGSWSRPIPPSPLASSGGKSRNLADGDRYGSLESAAAEDNEMTSTEAVHGKIPWSDMSENGDIELTSTHRPDTSSEVDARVFRNYTLRHALA